MPERSDFDFSEYENSGESAKVVAASIARKMSEYYTDKTVRKMASVGTGYFQLSSPRDYADWQTDYLIKMPIHIVESISDDMMKNDIYPLDNRYLCIHYLENESDSIIYTTDINAVESVMHHLSEIYEHRENSYESTPYEAGSQEAFFYKTSNRVVSYGIHPIEDSEDYLLELKFSSC